MKKWLVIVLGLSLLAAACSQGSGNGSSKNTPSPAGQSAGETQSPATEQPAPEAAADPLGKYESEVTVSTVGIPVASGYAEGEDVNDNFVVQYYRDYLNVNYVNKWVVESSEANEKLNLAIVSNDLPDVFSVGLEQLNRLIKADQIEDLTEVYETYASDNLSTLLNFGDGVAFIPSRVGGKLYGLPRTSDYANGIALMHIREDWLRKLNLKAPETLEELVAVAKAFVEQDPDGNGVDDTLAIALDQTLGVSEYKAVDAIAHVFKAYPKIWTADDSGSLVYGSVQPAMKSTLEALRELYQLGAFDEEFAVNNLAKAREKVVAGKVGIVFGPFYLPLSLIPQTRATVPGAEWKAYPIMTNTDGQFKPKSGHFANNWFVVRKGYDNPEALVKSMNLWYEIWQGQYSDAYNQLLKEKYPQLTGTHNYARPAFFDPPDKNLRLGINFREALATDDRNVLKTEEARKNWDIMKSGTDQGHGYKEVFGGSWRVLAEDYDELQLNEFYSAPTPTMVTRLSTLNTLEDENFTKIMMGEAPLSAFDDFVNEWNRLGGQQITEEVNEWYRSLN